MRSSRLLGIKNFAHESGDWLLWTRLPRINGYRVVSISCDEERKNWEYACYFDPKGEKAAALKATAMPPLPIFNLFGNRNVNGRAMSVRQITFVLRSKDKSKPNPLVIVRGGTRKTGLYFETLGNMRRSVGCSPGTDDIGIMDCEYGLRVLAVLDTRLTTKEKKT